MPWLANDGFIVVLLLMLINLQPILNQIILCHGLWTWTLQIDYGQSWIIDYSKVDVVAEDDNSLGKIEYILITIVKQNFANNRKMQIYYVRNECSHILLSLFKIKELNDLNQKRIYGKNIYDKNI